MNHYSRPRPYRSPPMEANSGIEAYEDLMASIHELRHDEMENDHEG